MRTLLMVCSFSMMACYTTVPLSVTEPWGRTLSDLRVLATLDDGTRVLFKGAHIEGGILKGAVLNCEEAGVELPAGSICRQAHARRGVAVENVRSLEGKRFSREKTAAYVLAAVTAAAVTVVAIYTLAQLPSFRGFNMSW